MAKDIPINYTTVVSHQDEPNTVEFTWEVENVHNTTLRVYNDIIIEGEAIDSFSEIIDPGETREYRNIRYEGVPAGESQRCCIETTGTDPRAY